VPFQGAGGRLGIVGQPVWTIHAADLQGLPVPADLYRFRVDDSIFGDVGPGIDFSGDCRGLELSFPSVIASSGFAFAEVFVASGSPMLAMMTSLCIGGFAGWINGLVVVVWPGVQIRPVAPWPHKDGEAT
jgi:hypothetical protein